MIWLREYNRHVIGSVSAVWGAQASRQLSSQHHRRFTSLHLAHITSHQEKVKVRESGRGKAEWELHCCRAAWMITFRSPRIFFLFHFLTITVLSHSPRYFIYHGLLLSWMNLFLSNVGSPFVFMPWRRVLIRINKSNFFRNKVKGITDHEKYCNMLCC